MHDPLLTPQHMKCNISCSDKDVLAFLIILMRASPSKGPSFAVHIKNSTPADH